jgi:NAD(P)-dependent dehydrogenase (short-subunit alcohol dehydrogenase family)
MIEMASERTALITGASTGIGRATAHHLDSLGWRVFAGVRKEADADSLREADGRVEPVTIDVTDEASIAAVAERIDSESLGGLAGLVNNAGVALAGPLEGLPVAEVREQIEINLIGQVAVTQAMLPTLRNAQGRIVFLSSIGGRIALPFNGPYSASKFGLEAIADSWRQELAPWGIEVSLIEPGGVATPIWDKGVAEAERISEDMPPQIDELYGERIEKFRKLAAQAGSSGIAPQEVAEAITEALTARRPKTRYLMGRDAKMRARVKSLIPDRTFDRLVARQIDS